MLLDEEKRYYVYEWYVKNTGEVFYVGKGTNKRYLTRKRENKYFMKMLNSHDCESRIVKNNLTEKEAFDLEIELIAKYRKTDFRLTNIQDGGENPPKTAGTKKSDESKRKMSKSMKLFYKTNPQSKANMSNRMIEFLKTDKGKEFQMKSIKSRDNDEFRKEQSKRCRKANNTKEYIERQSAIVKEMWKSEEYKKAHSGENNVRANAVKQYDLDGNFIKEYKTIKEASEKTGANASKISDVASGNRKTAGGYVWKYSCNKNAVNKREYKKGVPNLKCSKAIEQYDKDGNFLKEYVSAAEAVRENGFKDRTNIISCLKSKTKTAYGYVWKYK